MSYDVSAAPNKDYSGLVLHRPDCPVVRAQADAGEMVVTMFDCEQIPPDFERHDCMGEQ
jgi:hypothetical protein